MTQQSYAIEVEHLPRALVRVVNPILGVLLRTPLAGTLGKQLMLVSFTGRKTGRQYTIPLSAHLINGELYALTGAPWKVNFRDDADAQVVHDGKTTARHAEIIGSHEVSTDLYLQCAQSYSVKHAQRMMGLTFREQRTPTREQFSEAIDRLKLVAIRLTPIG